MRAPDRHSQSYSDCRAPFIQHQVPLCSQEGEVEFRKENSSAGLNTSQELQNEPPAQTSPRAARQGAEEKSQKSIYGQVILMGITPVTPAPCSPLPQTAKRVRRGSAVPPELTNISPGTPNVTAALPTALGALNAQGERSAWTSEHCSPPNSSRNVLESCGFAAELTSHPSASSELCIYQQTSALVTEEAQPPFLNAPHHFEPV